MDPPKDQRLVRRLEAVELHPSGWLYFHIRSPKGSVGDYSCCHPTAYRHGSTAPPPSTSPDSPPPTPRHPADTNTPLSPPSAPVQGRLQGPPAKKQIPNSRTTSLPAGPPRPCLKIEKCLLETRSGEKVVQVPINLTPVCFMPRNDRFAHTLESHKVSPGIPVTESMIGNHSNPGFEELC